MADINALGILPRKIFFLGGKEASVVNLRHMSIGQVDNLQVISKFLAKLKLDKADLSHNNIQDLHSGLLLPAIHHIRVLDLSYNQLAAGACGVLA